MQYETAGMGGLYPGQYAAPTCDFCANTAATVENGIPVCGLHARLDGERP